MAFVTVHPPVGTFIPCPSPRLDRRRHRAPPPAGPSGFSVAPASAANAPSPSSSPPPTPFPSPSTPLSPSLPESEDAIIFSSTPAARAPVERAVVWFRDTDLRVSDHVGLESACEHTRTALAHLFVVTSLTSAPTLRAAALLRTELRARGATLSVRRSEPSADGEAEAAAQFAEQFGAQRMHVRDDVEAGAKDVVAALRSRAPHIDVAGWCDDLREWALSAADLARMPDLFPKFRAWPMRRRAPVVPSASEFAPPLIVPAGPDEASEDPALHALLDVGDDSGTPVREWRAQFRARYDADAALANALPDDDNCDGQDSSRAGEQRLLAYLHAAEKGPGLPDYGRSLGELFQHGALSPRRVRQVVVDFERSNGRLVRPIFRDAAKLVLNALDAKEFSTLLARRDLLLGRTVDGTHAPRFWRWNGSLIRYVEEGVYDGTSPTVLLIHGFGASSFHFQKSVTRLKQRYKVFAIDLVGFGRSDKPPMQYTSAVWEALVWDFVRNVVRRPVYVAGNSIGGIFASGFGVDAYPTLSAGICLINTAGPMTTASTAVARDGDGGGRGKYFLRRWRWLRRLAGRLILKSLQGRVLRTLNVVYPTNPLDADSRLPDEIMRASYDYGAVDVLASGLVAPQQRGFDALLKAYDGPLLVFNGILDPLGNVRLRTQTFETMFPQAKVVTTNAGHCPHDEVAEEFVEALSRWIDESEVVKAKSQSLGDARPVV